jgi:hypothetical protein
MSFNEQFSTQREIPGSQFDPEPSVRGPFDHAFNIFENDCESLTEVASSQISVPTQLQRSNEDSHVAIAEPPPAFNTPFDYTWVDWDSPSLNGMTRLSRHMRTTAWWWQYGVPLEGSYIAKTTKKPAFGLQFLCRACHIAAPRSTEPFVIQDGRQSALEHFRKVHFKTYEEETNNNLGRDLDRCHAIEVLRTNDLEQREVHNRLAKATDPDVLRKYIFRWVIYDNIPFQKLESPYFHKIVGVSHPLCGAKAIPTRTTISRWSVKGFELHKQEIRDSIRTAISRVHLAFDLWTSSRRKAINGITANWVDQRGHCQTALLALVEMDDDHDGDSIAESIIPVIEDYGFGDKIGFLVLDNASSNETACAALGRVYKFNPIERRCRCVGHILNLVAQEILFGNDFDKFRVAVTNVEELAAQTRLWRDQGPIGMLAQIVRWINRSPRRVKRFENAQREVWARDELSRNAECRVLRLHQDNATR